MRARCITSTPAPDMISAFDVDDAGEISGNECWRSFNVGEKADPMDSASTPRARSGWRYGAGTRCVATRRVANCSLESRCRRPSPRAVRSAARMGRRSTSRPPAKTCPRACSPPSTTRAALLRRRWRRGFAARAVPTDAARRTVERWQRSLTSIARLERAAHRRDSARR